MNRKSETKNRGFIVNIVLIAVILAVVFLSQWEYLKPFGKILFSWGEKEINLYWTKTTDWFKESLYPKITGEVEKRGEPLKEEAITQKDNVVKNIWGKIKIYFAEKFSKISGTKVE